MEIWHASAPEMLWTALGLIGMYFAKKNLDASRERIKELERINGGTFEKYQIMRVVAYGHFRNDLFRFAKHATIFFIGVFAMLLPSATVKQSVTATSIVITVGLFTISLLLVLASILDTRQREALEGMPQ